MDRLRYWIKHGWSRFKYVWDLLAMFQYDYFHHNRVKTPPPPKHLRHLDTCYESLLEKTYSAKSDADVPTMDELRKLRKPDADKLDIVDDDYWWSFKGHEYPWEIPLFELIEDYRVHEELTRKLDNNEFPVIEIPANVMQVVQLLNSTDFDYGEIAELIHHSPALTGEVIKIINSSFFSRGIPIHDLDAALPRLGNERLKSILYIYSAKLSLPKDSIVKDVAIDVVEHSCATGLIAGYLSQRYYPDPEGAFLAGLMHDIGKLGILKAFSETYPVPQQPDYDISEELFDNVFPKLHERAGSFLARHWELSDEIIAVIRHHHDFLEADFGDDSNSFFLCALINLSDYMARILGKGRRIPDAVNIFNLPAAREIGVEKNWDTIHFLEKIPDLIAKDFLASKTAQRK